MAELLLFGLINLMQAVVDKYKDVEDLKQEVKQFRQILRAVKQVLIDVLDQLQHDRPQHTSLREPVDILRQAVENGDQVLQKCMRSNNTKQRLKHFFFTKKYLEKLAASTSEMAHALSLLSAAGVVMQTDILDGLEDVDKKVTELKQMAAVYQNELLDRLEKQSADLEALPERLLDLLVSQGIVNDREDYAEQLEEIKLEKEELEKKKVEFDSRKATMDEQFLIYNMHMLEVAVQLSLNERDERITAIPVQSDSSMLEALKCPISLDTMEDPVVLHQSSVTFDKKSICQSLLLYPDIGIGQDTSWRSCLSWPYCCSTEFCRSTSISLHAEGWSYGHKDVPVGS